MSDTHPLTGSLKLVHRHVFKMVDGRERRVSAPFVSVPVLPLLVHAFGVKVPEVIDEPHPDWPAGSGQRRIVVRCRNTGAEATDDGLIKWSYETATHLVGDSRLRLLRIGRGWWEPVKNCFSAEGYYRLAGCAGGGVLNAQMMRKLVTGIIELPVTQR